MPLLSTLKRLARMAGVHVEPLGRERPLRISHDHRIDTFDLAVRASDPTRDTYFFIQVGANDGLTQDPIRRYVISFHWKGILLEPQPDVFVRLKANYQSENQLILVNAALGAKDGTATLYSAKAGTSGSHADQLASFDQATLLKHLGNPAYIESRTVPVVTFSSLVANYQVAHIDLLQIDAEGYDFEVIKLLLATRARPRIIHFEHKHLSESAQSECEALLASHGYRMGGGDLDTVAILHDAQTSG